MIIIIINNKNNRIQGVQKQHIGLNGLINFCPLTVNLDFEHNFSAQDAFLFGKKKKKRIDESMYGEVKTLMTV